MRIRLFLVLFQVAMLCTLFAQKPDRQRPLELSQEESDQTVRDSSIISQKGELTIIQEERIGILDEYMKSHPLKHEGYRVQLVFGSRNEVSTAKSKFLARWDYSAYESFLQPNFRLRVGDFQTRNEADKMLADFKMSFPGAYVVQDKIEVPKRFR